MELPLKSLAIENWFCPSITSLQCLFFKISSLLNHAVKVQSAVRALVVVVVVVSSSSYGLECICGGVSARLVVGDIML